MTKEMLDKWLEAFNDLEKRYNRFLDKMSRHEREGKMELAKKNEARMDMIAEKQKGMIDALEIFGYAVQYQDGKYVVVVK